jgi:hypothetical protein
MASLRAVTLCSGSGIWISEDPLEIVFNSM